MSGAIKASESKRERWKVPGEVDGEWAGPRGRRRLAAGLPPACSRKRLRYRATSENAKAREASHENAGIREACQNAENGEARKAQNRSRKINK